MKVSEDVFGYSEAIKSCLRMNPKWIMLSEARSKAVSYTHLDVYKRQHYNLVN